MLTDPDRVGLGLMEEALAIYRALGDSEGAAKVVSG